MYLKKWAGFILVAALLTGCTAEETLETVSDEWVVPVMAQPREISVRLPEDTVAPVLEQDGRRLYMGRDYEIMLETLSSGDLSATIRSLCGYEQDQLTVLETRQGDYSRYDFVWTMAGETGDRLGRAVILDDGEYHYCMSAIRDQGDTQIPWRDVFGSFSLT